MKLQRSVIVVAIGCCVTGSMSRIAEVDDRARETVFTFNKDVGVPGRVLPSGKYVFRLADSPENRHLVEILDILVGAPHVHATTALVSDDDQDEEQAARRGRHQEEVRRHDLSDVIAQERPPGLRRRSSSWGLARERAKSRRVGTPSGPPASSPARVPAAAPNINWTNNYVVLVATA
jgi:hypothetical protein